MSLSQQIKDYALSIGYDYAGIINADGFPGYLEDLEDRYEMYQFAIEGPFRLYQASDIKLQMPAARSIIVVAYDYLKESFPDNLSKMIGRFYLSRAQPSSRYSPMNLARRKLMKEFLASLGCNVGDKVAVPERLAAVRSGVASYGKNSFAFGRNNGGSFLILSSFVVDVELEYDQPVYEAICPENCNLCIDACPTGAIYEPYKIDPRQCITLTNTAAGNVPGLDKITPPVLREQIGIHIHGCDICQEVCPRNRPGLQTPLPANSYLDSIIKNLQFSSLLNMDEETYQTRVRPLLYNYLNKRKYLQRNAAIALGNLCDPGTIPDLEIAMQSEEEMVRAYSAWALGRIGGKAPSPDIYSSAPAYAQWAEQQDLRNRAEKILLDALDNESSDWVVQEIHDALTYIQDNKAVVRLSHLIM